MDSLGLTRTRIGILSATFVAVSLSACAPQSAVPAEVKAGTQQTHRPAEPRAPAVSRITVPAGTELRMTLSTSVGSETSQVGDSLSATTTAPVIIGDRVAIPIGSTIHGRVTDVVQGKKGLKVSEKGGAIVLAFDKVTTPQGSSTPMSASLTSIASSGGKTAGIIGGSAAGGALLGKILGGRSKDAAVGAVLGAGIGTGIAAGTKGKEMSLPAGTELAIVLDEALILGDRS